MEKFISKEDLLLEIGSVFAKMENSKISLDDLNQLVKYTTDLHERSIILRYKAIEASVFGKEDLVEMTDVAPVIHDEDEENAENQYNLEEDLELNQEEVTHSIPEEVIDNIQDEIIEEKEVIVKEEPQPFGFNLFDFEEEVKEENSESTPNSSIISDQLEAEQQIEEELIPDTSTFSDDAEAIEGDNSFEETSPEEFQEQGFSSAKLEEDEVGEPTAFSYGELASFISKFNQVETITSTQFGLVKIDSLIGSFGLNERLQYINELFDGSSENFSDAIKVLDNQTTIDSAKTKVAELALINNWDIDSETIVEFMQKVVRRYA